MPLARLQPEGFDEERFECGGSGMEDWERKRTQDQAVVVLSLGGLAVAIATAFVSMLSTRADFALHRLALVPEIFPGRYALT